MEYKRRFVSPIKNYNEYSTLNILYILIYYTYVYVPHVFPFCQLMHQHCKQINFINFV